MRAVSRCRWLLAAGALALVPATALAQEAPATTNAPTTNAPAPADSVGPRDLQNFSLNGTVTRPADQPAATQPAPRQRRGPVATPPVQPSDQPAATRAETAGRQGPAAPSPAPRAARTAAIQQPPTAQPQPQPAPEPLRQSQPSSSVTASLPALGATGSGSAAAAPAAVDFAPAPRHARAGAQHSAPPVAARRARARAGRRIPLLAQPRSRRGLRRRSRVRPLRRARARARSDPRRLSRRAPRRVPPAPAPAPKPASPESFGVVSSRLRPWIEIGFSPTRCVLDEQALTVEFELELFNSGSVPARGGPGRRGHLQCRARPGPADRRLHRQSARGRASRIEIPPLEAPRPQDPGRHRPRPGPGVGDGRPAGVPPGDRLQRALRLGRRRGTDVGRPTSSAATPRPRSWPRSGSISARGSSAASRRGCFRPASAASLFGRRQRARLALPPSSRTSCARNISTPRSHSIDEKMASPGCDSKDREPDSDRKHHRGGCRDDEVVARELVAASSG